MPDNKIYNPQYVAQLFNNMSATYGLTNYISSFGFTERWRKKCVNYISPHAESLVAYDLMSGMGELWPTLHNSDNDLKEVRAVDISPAMNKRARENSKNLPFSIEFIEVDVLENRITSESADIIISSFGLKTFNKTQLKHLAKEVFRILKPGGQFAFVEISKPEGYLLKHFYLFYLKFVIPLIGILFMGNSNDYRMLGIYTENFSGCEQFKAYLLKNGLSAKSEKLFFGCASTTWGYKPLY